MTQLMMWPLMPVQLGDMPGPMILHQFGARNHNHTLQERFPPFFPLLPQILLPTSLPCTTTHQALHFPQRGLIHVIQNYMPEPPVEQSLYDIETLPVNAKLVGDGDGMIIHVDVSEPQEADKLPQEVYDAAVARLHAKATRNYVDADALQNAIIKAGYRIIKGPMNEEILAKEYRVRLKGIDAPEMGMIGLYGREGR